MHEQISNRRQHNNVCGAATKLHSEAIFHLKAFRIDRHEVTVEQYTKCVKKGHCKVPSVNHQHKADKRFNWGASGRDKHPMIGVSYGQADVYCEWNKRRLPTAAERR